MREQLRLGFFLLNGLDLPKLSLELEQDCTCLSLSSDSVRRNLGVSVHHLIAWQPDVRIL